MRKLTLNLEDLKVDSFETTPPAADTRGTVFGLLPTEAIPCPTDANNDWTCGIACATNDEPTCFAGGCGGGGDTQDLSCYNGCNASGIGTTCYPDEWTCGDTCHLGQYGCETLGSEITCMAYTCPT